MKNKKSKKKLIIIILIIVVVLVGIATGIILILNNKDKDNSSSEEHYTTEKETDKSSEEEMISAIEHFIGSSEVKNIRYEKNENGNYVINFDYDKNIMYLHVCAADSQTIIKKIINRSIENANKIEAFNMYCKENGNSKYIITINNYMNLTEEILEENTIIKDNNGNNLNKTVTQTKEDYVNDYKNSCKTYDYKTIYRYAEEYKGKNVKYTGKVVQVIEHSSFNSYRIDITKDKWGYYDDTVYVSFLDLDNNTPRILEGDIVTFYGTLGDLYTYTTVLGGSVTIPSVTASYIDIN